MAQPWLPEGERRVDRQEMKRRKERKKEYLWNVVVVLLYVVITGGVIGGGIFWLLEFAESENASMKQVEEIAFLGNDIAEAGIRSYMEKEESLKEKPAEEEPAKEEPVEDVPVTEEIKSDVSIEAATEESGKDISSVIEAETVQGITAKRISSTKISIFWNGIYGSESAGCEQYRIMRRGMSSNIVSDTWEEVGVVRADQTLQKNKASGTGAEYTYSFTDTLPSSKPVQYEYRVDAKTADGTLYVGAGESTVVASNVLICVDPGHYKGASIVPSDETMYGYEEGIFTLRLGFALREELAKHGINSYLTRETDSITIDNYTNEALDKGKISLRGAYAAGSNLFISIHTNANGDNANGYDTWHQPLEINKTLIILNQTASNKESFIAVANEIGAAVTATSYRLGLSVTNQFERAAAGFLLEWTGDYNDSVNVKGTVCYRLGDKGDYYGVLRGAASVEVPGMIIEHGFHTVEEMRRQAMTENLANEWAKADADGIAKGFGFQ